MLNKKLVIITGSSSGIGAQLARVFNKAGYPLALLSRDLAKMESLNLSNTLCLQTDVTNPNEVTNSIKAAEEHFGFVDCLINNAGCIEVGDFTDITNEKHKQVIETNILGVIYTTNAVLPGMTNRKSGTVLNISSLADRNVRSNFATYAASKAAIKSLTASLQRGYAQFNIRFCNIAPGIVKTNLAVQNKLNEQMLASNDIAQTILWIYEQPQDICIRDLVIAPTQYNK